MAAVHRRFRKSPPENQRKAGGRPPHGKRGNWSLLSAQGRVLLMLPVVGIPRSMRSRNLDLTEQAIWGVVRDLRQHGLIHLRKRGRRHHYAINLDAPFLHPTIVGLTLRPVLGAIAARAVSHARRSATKPHEERRDRGYNSPASPSFPA